MLQHISSEVIIIQLQINLNSKNNCTDWELTKLIDIKRQEYANNRDDCKIKECLLIRDLKPALNENVGSGFLLYVTKRRVFN